MEFYFNVFRLVSCLVKIDHNSTFPARNKQMDICLNCRCEYNLQARVENNVGLQYFCSDQCALDYALDGLDTTDSETQTFDYSDVSEGEEGNFDEDGIPLTPGGTYASHSDPRYYPPSDSDE